MNQSSQTESPPAPAEDSAVPAKARVLVVDDLEDNLRLLTTILAAHLPDAELVTASDGQAALALARRAPPDLVLLDVRMPGMDGFAVCRALKENPATAGIPILMLSAALIEPGDRAQGLHGGADGYLCKPFENEELVAQVKALLRLKRYQDRLRRHEQHLQEELRRRTATLRESEARFRTMFENSPDAIFVEDETGRVLDANPAACSLHGMERDALLSCRVADLVPPEEHPRLRRDFKKWISGEITCYEGRSRGPDGEVIPVEIRGSRIEYDGRPAVLLQVRDVSRRRRVEEALQDLAQGVSLDTGMSFFYALVQRLAETLGVDYALIGEVADPAEKFIRTVAAYAHGEILDDFSYPLEGSPCGVVLREGPRRYPRGVRRAFPRSKLLADLRVEGYIGMPLYGKDGRRLGLMCVMHGRPIENIDLAESLLSVFAARAGAELERKKAAEELWEAQEQYRSLIDDVFDTSSVGLSILDGDCRVIWVNQALGTFFGMRRDELVGQDKRALIETRIKHFFEDPDAFARRLLNAYNEGAGIERMECHILPDRDRQERWIEYRSRPITSGFYTGGRIQHYIDITALKQLEGQLLQAQKMESIGRLAGGIAHDFNNLLTSILGFGRLLLDDLPEQSPSRADVQEIVNSGERAAGLTRQLLAVGRRQMLDIGPMDLNTVIEDMAQLLRRTLGEDVHLRTLLEEDLPWIEADHGQMEQVLMNLAVNARDAMPHGGALTISTTTTELDEEACRRHEGFQPGTYVLVNIQDTGIGMNKETREHAFEPFFTTKEMGKGTGLGLSTVYGIVQQIGGDAVIHSEPGKGTDILLYLPAATKKGAVSEPRAETAPLPGGTETILLVEDEDTVRRLTTRLLRAHGYRVLPAPSAKEALAICRNFREPIHLVLTDVIMPRMSGPEMVRSLRKLRPRGKVLYTSGFAEETILEHGVANENLEVLAKPYKREVLLRRVRTLLDAR